MGAALSKFKRPEASQTSKLSQLKKLTNIFRRRNRTEKEKNAELREERQTAKRQTSWVNIANSDQHTNGQFPPIAHKSGDFKTKASRVHHKLSQIDSFENFQAPIQSRFSSHEQRQSFSGKIQRNSRYTDSKSHHNISAAVASPIVDEYQRMIEKLAAMEDHWCEVDSGCHSSQSHASYELQGDHFDTETSLYDYEDEDTASQSPVVEQSKLINENTILAEQNYDLPLHVKLEQEFPRFDHCKTDRQSNSFVDDDCIPEYDPTEPQPTSVRIPMVVNGQIFPLTVHRNSELAVAYNLVEYYANKNQHIAKRICTIRARLGAKFLFPVFVHGRVVNIPLDAKDKNVKAYREISALKCFQYEQMS
eukprot:gene12746-3473_t